MLQVSSKPSEPSLLSQEHREIMQAGAAALEAEDLHRYLQLHYDDVLFHVFAPNHLSGDYQGKSELSSLHQAVKNIVGGVNFSVDVHDTFVTEAHGIWIVQYYPDRENSSEHDTLYVVCQFNQGRISEAWFVLWPKKVVTSSRPPDGH